MALVVGQYLEMDSPEDSRILKQLRGQALHPHGLFNAPSI